MSGTLVLMQGPPGSGKSTDARASYPGACIVSADDYFSKNGRYEFNPVLLGAAHDECKGRARAAMERGEPLIVVDNTNIRRAHVAVYHGLAAQFGYAVIAHRCDGRFPNTHGVPEEKVERMRRQMEVIA